MSRPVETVDAETPVSGAASQLSEEGVGSLVVEARTHRDYRSCS